jgi:hypothetical protein
MVNELWLLQGSRSVGDVIVMAMLAFVHEFVERYVYLLNDW